MTRIPAYFTHKVYKVNFVFDSRSELVFCFLEAYSEPCQTSKMERFAKIINCFYEKAPS